MIATRAGVAENTPPIEPPFTTFRVLLGNYIVEALGHHRFALYAHLHTGSLRVRTGERVHRGQVLALVGNTGNSTEPHLHFHVTSGPSPLASDGVPYVFRSFRYDARLVGLDTGNPAIVPADPPATANGSCRWTTTSSPSRPGNGPDVFAHHCLSPEKISRKNRNTFSTSRKIDAASSGASALSVLVRSR